MAPPGAPGRRQRAVPPGAPWAYGLAADGTGRVFIAQSRPTSGATALSPNRIGRLDPATNVFTQWDVPPIFSGAFLVDFTGVVWFTEFQNARLARLDPAMNAITEWNLPASSFPEGVVEK